MLAGVSPSASQAPDATTFAGRWTYNRELSQAPREVGFNADWMTAGTAGGDGSGGGRGGQAGGGAARSNFPVIRESREDSARIKALTTEVREPSPRLTIVETAPEVTITTDNNSSRTFHPGLAIGDSFPLPDASVIATTRREAGKLIITYKVVQGRELRYTYSRVATPPQLVVDIQLIERGKNGDSLKLIYEPEKVVAAPAAAPAPARPAAASMPPAQTGSRPAAPVSATGRPNEDYDRAPDAQLKGLTKLGVVVEGLSAQATACGLKQDAMESAMSKQLSSAGFTITLNSDDDTYLYVNVMTATLANGLCISRFDATVYTHTTAKLEYHATPVLVDVSLLHKGSIAAGSSATHGEMVMKGLQDFVNQFTKQIRDANK